MSVENKIKLYRVQAGDITQDELAKRAACSRQTIHSIESGKFNPSIELALRIARVLDVSVSDLFILKDEPV
ncbi:MAG: helix-turn-helix transcriptional regulator [Bdellovibrionota bacterium]